MPPQGLDYRSLREYTVPPFTSVPDDSECYNILWDNFPDLFIPKLCLLFAIDCTSHVSFICFHSLNTPQTRRSLHGQHRGLEYEQGHCGAGDHCVGGKHITPRPRRVTLHPCCGLTETLSNFACY